MADDNEPTVMLPCKSEQIAYHMAEFTALKSEIAGFVKAAAADLRYALLASGGIFAWLAARLGEGNPAIGENAWLWWLPAPLSFLFGIHSWAA